MKINNKSKEYLIVISILAVFSVFVFYKTIFFGKTFAWYNDQLFQHNVFYQEWYRLVKESISTKTLAIYSWNTFLGTDFLVSKLMYCVGDYLITPFFIFWNGEINYDLLFAVTTIITIVISGITMMLYLKKLEIEKKYLLITIPIVYALGGFAMTYTGSYMFHRFYSLLPLLFYYCEKYLQENKTVGFSVIVAILFLQSYELLFSTALFLIVYFIVSKRIKNETNIKDILKKSIRLIISFIIGILLCGIFLLPLFLYLRSNTRVGGYEYDGIIWNFKTILGFITNLFVPAFNFRSNIPSYLFYSNSHFSNEYGYFATALVIMAFIVLMKEGNKKDKKTILIAESVLLAFLLIKPLNSIIHGFSVPTLRWSFLIEFYHMFVISYVFNKYDFNENCRKEINTCYIIYFVLYALFIVYYKVDLKEYWISLVINLLVPSVMYLYNYLFISKKIKAIAYLTIITSMVFYSLSIFATYGVYDNKELTYDIKYLEYLQDTETDLMSRYHFNSEELWPYSWLNLNQSIVNNYMGVSTYDSTYETTLSSFLSSNGEDSWMISIDNPNIVQMLGVKYWIVSDDDKLPNDLELEFLTNFDTLSVYKINNFNHIGHTYSSFVSETDYIDFDFNNVLKINEEDYELISDINVADKTQLVIEEYNNQYMKGKIEVPSKEVLLVSIPYSEGWTVKDQNGNKLKTINVDDGFLGVIVDENVSELSFYYLTPGIKTGAIISLVGFLLLVVEIIIDKFSKNYLYK